MSEVFIASFSGFLLMLVALVFLLMVIPAASAAGKKLKPAWRSAVWPLMFGSFALSGLCSALASLNPEAEVREPLWKLVSLLAGFGFTFLALNSLYRVLPNTAAWRYAPFLWIMFLFFSGAVLFINSLSLLLAYDTACAVLVFAVYSTIYARQRDRASDALPIMIGTALILLADLAGSLAFRVNLGFAEFNQLLPYNLLTILALYFYSKGASASYSIKYDLQRTRERESAISGRV